MQSATTGSLTIKYRDVYYSLPFLHNGWLAGDLLQYVDEVITAEDPRIAILKLLGYTMLQSAERPPRSADHWVEVDVAKREIVTNSEFVRRAVDQEVPDPDKSPYSPVALRRLHEVLDRFNFTVRFRKS